MTELYFSLNVISRYLSTSLRPSKLIFNKQYAINNEYFEPLIKNSLFRLKFREIKNDDG